ncbi:MAG: hypothetical protein IJP51_00240 [Acidaminococcaceae bacterium]|nr:hypothetical protein [Acidaminococcaceae bacterium]MBQ6777911.1 hypothetical protein [Acidaminococcaceae bacterium]
MLHQAEKYIKQIVEEIGRPSYMQEFLKQGKDKQAIEDVAGKLKQFSENMSVLQPIAIKGFMVPSGSLMLYQYLKEELDVMETVLREEPANATTGAADRKEKLTKYNKVEAGLQATAQTAHVLSAEQKEEMRKRVGIVKHRLPEMMESLLAQHIADQIEQRTDEEAAQEAFQEHGYLPLYVDEKTMGIVYNTLTMQLLLDRFNLLFEGVLEPMDQGTVTSVMSNVLAPYWKQNAQSILFTMEEEQQ